MADEGVGGWLLGVDPPQLLFMSYLHLAGGSKASLLSVDLGVCKAPPRALLHSRRTEQSCSFRDGNGRFLRKRQPSL